MKFKLCVCVLLGLQLVSANAEKCLEVGVTITQKIEYEGFHR